MTDSERLLREGFELAVDTAELCHEAECEHDRVGSHINWTAARKALEERIADDAASEVTDEQIRALRPRSVSEADDQHIAMFSIDHDRRMAARARCAVLINARTKESK